jgi:hypothetical protein
MKIADVSIRQPVFITMVIVALVVIGGLSYTRLGVDLMPDFSLPIVAVTVANPGVGPEEMESQVTKPIDLVGGRFVHPRPIRPGEGPAGGGHRGPGKGGLYPQHFAPGDHRTHHRQI